MKNPNHLQSIFFYFLAALLFLGGCSSAPYINAYADKIEFSQSPVGMTLEIDNGNIRVAPGGGDDPPDGFYQDLNHGQNFKENRPL